MSGWGDRLLAWFSSSNSKAEVIEDSAVIQRSNTQPQSLPTKPSDDRKDKVLDIQFQDTPIDKKLSHLWKLFEESGKQDQLEAFSKEYISEYGHSSQNIKADYLYRTQGLPVSVINRIGQEFIRLSRPLESELEASLRESRGAQATGELILSMLRTASKFSNNRRVFLRSKFITSLESFTDNLVKIYLSLRSSDASTITVCNWLCFCLDTLSEFACSLDLLKRQQSQQDLMLLISML